MALVKFVNDFMARTLMLCSVQGEYKKMHDKTRMRIAAEFQISDLDKKRIDEIYVNNYGEKIPYLWHQYYAAHSGKMDVNYFPEMLYIPYFERFMNYNTAYAQVFEDKNYLPYIAKAANIKMPKIIIQCCEGLLRNGANVVINKKECVSILNDIDEEVFIKPTVDSGSGKGCFVAQFKDGKDIISRESIGAIIDSLGMNFVIQKKLHCHKTISDIFANSVNTFRVITYRWKDDFICMPIIMRIGQGKSVVDNAHAGGMFIGVKDNGELLDFAMTEFNDRYYSHPNTNLIFKGHSIIGIDKIKQAALYMHTMMSSLGVINWDFTIDEEGEPVLLESNIMAGSVWLNQMAHGCGLFGDKLTDVLQWIKKCKHVRYSDMYKYQFGK